MLTLRQEHLDAFAACYRRTFVDHMVQHLKYKFPTQCEELGDQRIRARIADGVERAKRYEINAQPDVARFIRFMFTIGPEFDLSPTEPWIRPILEETEVPASERLDRIRYEGRQRRQDKKMAPKPPV
jgi:hypothetical protein